MKTAEQIQTAQDLADMRSNALRARALMHHDNFTESYRRNFSLYAGLAASALESAISARNRARNLGQWSDSANP